MNETESIFRLIDGNNNNNDKEQSDKGPPRVDRFSSLSDTNIQGKTKPDEAPKPQRTEPKRSVLIAQRKLNSSMTKRPMDIHDYLQRHNRTQTVSEADIDVSIEQGSTVLPSPIPTRSRVDKPMDFGFSRTPSSDSVNELNLNVFKHFDDKATSTHIPRATIATTTGPSLIRKGTTATDGLRRGEAGGSNDHRFSMNPQTQQTDFDNLIEDIRQNRNLQQTVIDVELDQMAGQPNLNVSNLIPQDRLDICIFPPALSTWR